jgi:hypothetical protein
LRTLLPTFALLAADVCEWRLHSDAHVGRPAHHLQRFLPGLYFANSQLVGVGVRLDRGDLADDDA